jgi:hypothetical protein
MLYISTILTQTLAANGIKEAADKTWVDKTWAGKTWVYR